MIRIGCCGYPVARDAYHRRFATVEINSTFYALPRLSTAKRWREEAPEGFEFSVKAWQPVTHPSTSPTYRRLRPKIEPKRLARCGHFRQSDEVLEAWEKFMDVAEILEPRFILFQTPRSFYPNADHLRDIYKFFKRLRRRKSVLVWEPRGQWEDKLVKKVCEDLDLVHGVDPLHRLPVRGAVKYFRLHGKTDTRRIVYTHDYSDTELKDVLEKAGSGRVYVYFNNRAMWDDARRFERMTLGARPYRPRKRRPWS